MIEDIEFKDTGKKVTSTIDNESKSISIKEIIKAPTFIVLNKSLDTILEEDIAVDGILCYINKDNEDVNSIKEYIEVVDTTDSETAISMATKYLTQVTNINNLKIDIDGVVDITIYNGDNIYYQNSINFNRGCILDNIKNTLPIGEYVCEINYSGNKYFEPTKLTTTFNIEKRLSVCDFDTYYYTADAKESITISGILKDAEKDEPISGCVISFDFNGQKYQNMTGPNGEINIILTMPDPDISHCSSFITKEENTFPNASYIVNLYIENQNYYLLDTELQIIVQKAKTSITINTADYDEASNIVNFNGYVLANVLDTWEDVQYGEISISFDDFKYKVPNISVSDGFFSSDIDLAAVYDVYNATDIEELIPYSTVATYYTSIEIEEKESPSKISVGDLLTVTAKIKSTNSLDAVTDGMMVFILYDDNEEVYRYATELDDVGNGVFSFNTSKAGNYYVQVEYYGMFGYKDSKSEKYFIEVE